LFISKQCGIVVFKYKREAKMKSFSILKRAKQTPYRKGLTLLEALIAIVIIAVMALGSLSYQYLGAQHIRIADAQLTATRIGQMVLEDWKSRGAASGYDPTTINTALDAAIGAGFTQTTGYYVITVDGLTLYIDRPLTATVAANDPAGYAGRLYQIGVTVRWRNDFRADTPTAEDPSLVLTTYSK
jgi:prepilin-type N-terminal cleavage/methylation domain-containing protein